MFVRRSCGIFKPGLAMLASVMAAGAACGTRAGPAPLPGGVPPAAEAAAPPATPGAIVWSRLRPLRWEDFRGVPDPGADVTAVTFYVIGYEAECASGVLTVQVSSSFLPERSWVKPALLERADDRERALRHEQTHFDLSEVQARRIRQRLRELRGPCRATQAEFDALVQPFLDADAELQGRYDRETRHGTLAAPQAQWDERVRHDLDALNRYAR